MLLRLAHVIDRLSKSTGQFFAWGTLLMVLTTVAVVILRHVFQVGWIWLQEISVYLHALVFLLGAAYTLNADEHVRVDVFYRDMSVAKKRIVNTFGSVFFLAPTVAFIIWSSWSYVMRSWADKETSHETGGLIFPFPSLLKTSILVACVLLALQAISLMIRAWLDTDDSIERSSANIHHHEI